MTTGEQEYTGILLAGGRGTRLYPLTLAVEQAAAAGLRQADDLLPADDADAGGHPRDPDHLHPARICRASDELLGDGSAVGPRSSTTPSSRSPEGLAQAFLIGERLRRRRTASR